MSKYQIKVDIEQQPAKPRTLADVEPYVLCKEWSSRYYAWRDSGDCVVTFRDEHGEVFVDPAEPSEIRIAKVIGLIRIRVEEVEDAQH